MGMRVSGQFLSEKLIMFHNMTPVRQETMMNCPKFRFVCDLSRTLFLCVAATVALVLIGTSFSNAQEAGQTAYSKGLDAFMNGRYSEALSPFEESLQANPSDPRVGFFIGICLTRMGDAEAGSAWFRKAADLENTADGRLFNVNSALKRVQGEERIVIEDIRRESRLQWQRQEEQRQIQLFGQTLNREKSLISEQNRFEKPTPVTLSGQEGTAVASAVPSVAPISPLSKEEVDATKVPNLYDENDSEFQYFRDELGKTTLSTSQQERLREQESRVKYADPMDIPAKDGSPFINIYDPSRVVKDDEPFFGLDDPDDVYRDFEAGPLNSATTLITMTAKKFGGGVLTGDDEKSSGSSPDSARRPSRRPSDSGMGMGMPGREGGDQEEVANPDDDSSLLFGKTNGSPRKTDPPEASGEALDPFEADRGFSAEPPVEETDEMSGMMGPGMGM
ncbi:MAG: hypothetical protein Q4G68_03695 [Planctomycetia bacterium]|nr:hypothetical protein [Planctomycetia bacterium]